MKSCIKVNCFFERYLNEYYIFIYYTFLLINYVCVGQMSLHLFYCQKLFESTSFLMDLTEVCGRTLLFSRRIIEPSELRSWEISGNHMGHTQNVPALSIMFCVYLLTISFQFYLYLFFVDFHSNLVIFVLSQLSFITLKRILL